MKRAFLFVMVEGGGNVPPQLGVARSLVERGHRVRVLADPAVEAEARRSGCGFSPFRLAPHHNMRSRGNDILRDWAQPSPRKRLERLGQTLLFAPAPKYARDVLDELTRFPADAVVVDWMVLGAHIGAEASGLPTAILWHNPYSVPTEGIPPFGLGLRPARGPFGRFRDRALRRFMTRGFDGAGLSSVNQARAAFDLAPLDSVFDQLLQADRILVLTSRAFDFRSAALPAHVRHVGPRLDDLAWAAPWRSPWPEDHPDPLVLVSFGSTFQDQADVIRRTVEALGSLPARVLLTLGEVFSPEELPSAANVVAVRSAPHAAVLPIASAVVTHGGHGTVIKALAHGVPLVCVPLGRDQADNGVRVEVAGAGIPLRRTAGAARIRRAVSRVLEEPAFTEAARRIASVIRDEVEEGAAEKELEILARQKAASRIRGQEREAEPVPGEAS